MKHLFWTLLFTCTLSHLNAQTPVSFQFDASGNPIHGYLDDLSYQPNHSVRITHNSDSYESGFIYKIDGEKNSGLIKYQNNKISFKESTDDLPVNLRPDDIKGITIGIDSFFVIKDFYYNEILRKKEHFAQYLNEINGNEFVKYYKFVNYGTNPGIRVTYLARKKGTEIWHELSGISLKKYGGLYFNLVQDFNERLKNGDFRDETTFNWLNSSFNNYNFTYQEPLEPIEEGKVFNLIKELEYLHKYAKGNPIYFDSHWNETKKNDKVVRTGKIVNITDDFWEIHYYVGESKIYEAKYSSLFPHIKQDRFKVYHEGDLLREIMYQENKPTNVTVHHAGEKLYEYELKTVKDAYDKVVRNDRIYSYVKGVNGYHLLGSNRTKVIDVTDPLTHHTYTNTYTGGILKTSYRNGNDQKIHQIVNIDDKINLKKIQKRAITWFDTDELIETLSENAQGTVLIKLLIRPDGYVEDFTVFGSIHPEFDSKLKSFLNKSLSKNAEYRIKLKPFKIDKEKVYLETYIPFVFTINKFYRPPINYYYDWGMHNNMMHQQMMQQMNQNMINNIQVPTFNPPSF